MTQTIAYNPVSTAREFRKMFSDWLTQGLYVDLQEMALSKRSSLSYMRKFNRRKEFGRYASYLKQ